MNSDNRAHPRIKPKNLVAQIKIIHPPAEEFLTEGLVLDISYSGIKIKLNSPIQAVENDQITISLQLPKSGIPITIHGIIKHQLSNTECGIYFGDLHPEEHVDDLMFECVMHAHAP
ncbi:MAG: PilZ domain-containing protein [Methyloprofundus sp.]|nr:PilZ domain-containing protein [Methyloprofundus sp.]